MKQLIKRLFHTHKYEIKQEQLIETLYEGQFIKYYLIIQRCAECGDIKVDKVRI